MNSEYGSYTKNYHLLKPDDKDFYDIEHINGNMDIVDIELDKLDQKTIQLNEAVVDISGLIGTKTDTGGTNTEGTVMAKLNAVLDKNDDTEIDIDSIKELIGQTSNTGGTASSGSVMAKLNKMLSDWTNSRASKIDTINNVIGATANTGGTTQAGTVMAKLNASLQNEVDIKELIGQAANTGGTSNAGTAMAKLNKLLTDWTNARAVKIDTINSAIGTTGSTGGTATAGSVMAKLNALLSKVSGGVGIKSIQRGSFVEDFSVETVKTTKITISTVNPQKTFVIINGGLSAGYSNSSSAVRGYVGTVASTYFNYCAGRASLTIGAGTVGYQVVEFY
ncbi:hypothetical protein [Clostridium sp. MD294]|uniref:hypothetical protein n=1 Tax=Clostridium sp. MD294 TaxID=97138 RepID=UPI0002C9763E|nr:hypothetical protein [Clostridium sp. MD294]NDO46502.1 hypothetical protein [Clostridium sp. MD294]USF29068.1 hypothetical protein C820_000451 [Clostridium sp. MD294]